MYYATLPHRALASLSGDDVKPFLQGLISNDVSLVSETHAIYAALLTPQGRYLHDFFLSYSPSGLVLDGEKLRLTDLLQRFNLYKLRSKVIIEKLLETHGVIAVWGTTTSPLGHADPRLPALGFRLTGEVTELERACEKQGWKKVGAGDYDRMRLELGVPDGSGDMIENKSLLLECGFEELHGVNFTKGCYVGQEVTARSKHRGQLHKAFYSVRSESGELPGPGCAILCGDASIGEMRSHSGNIGLALLRIEELEKAQATQSVFHTGEINITVSQPSWRVKPAHV